MEQERVGLARAPNLKAVLASNAAVVVSAITGFLVFSGHGYYSAKFAAFALTPGILQLTHVEYVVNGFFAVVWVLYDLVATHYLSLVIPVIIATGISVVIAFAVHKSPRFAQALSRLRPWSDTIQTWNTRVLKWSLVLGGILTGLGAGFGAGKYDASRLQSARMRAANCFLIKGKLERGIILGQDQTRSVLVQPTRTKVFKNDDLDHVAACPRA